MLDEYIYYLSAIGMLYYNFLHRKVDRKKKREFSQGKKKKKDERKIRKDEGRDTLHGGKDLTTKGGKQAGEIQDSPSQSSCYRSGLVRLPSFVMITHLISA